jgi:hypothetical protein
MAGRGGGTGDRESAMSDNPVHLLADYGKAATKTLCGIKVPALRGASRGDLLWAHPGRESCAACQAAAKARAATLHVAPPKRTPGLPRLGPALLQRKPPKPIIKAAR